MFVCCVVDSRVDGQRDRQRQIETLSHTHKAASSSRGVCLVLLPVNHRLSQTFTDRTKMYNVKKSCQEGEENNT